MEYRQFKGQEIRTEHWIIYTTTTSPEWMDQLPVFVEACYAQYQLLVPAPDTSRCLTLYLFANSVQWEDYAALRGVSRSGPERPGRIGWLHPAGHQRRVHELDG